MRLCKDLNFSVSGVRRQKQYWEKKGTSDMACAMHKITKGNGIKRDLGSYLRLGGQGKYF